MEKQRPQQSRLLELVTAIVTVGGTVMVLWQQMPPDERMWAKLEMAHSLHRLTDRLAKRAGYRGMGDELAGRDLQRYQTAYLMSRLRDKLAGFRA